MKNIIYTILLLLVGLPAYANNIVALYPLIEREGGVDDMARIFYDELETVLLRVPTLGSYAPYKISLENSWFENNPPGSSPAYVCPPAEVTGIASYAITGEVFPDATYSGVYRLRLYLWETESQRLLITDEMIAHNKESCALEMPRFLDWLMSQIGKEKEEIITVVELTPPPQIIISVPVEVEPSYTPLSKWFYLGLRAGGGSSVWYYNPYMDIQSNNANVLLLYNANVAVQGTINLLSWLALQVEANLNMDLNSLDEATPGITEDDSLFTSMSLTVPLLLKINLQGGKVKGSIFAGAYYYLPLRQTENDLFDYNPDIPGFIFGGSIGWNVGPGFFFIDGRFDYDGYWRNSEQAVVYYRNLVKLTAGYEWGFLNKKTKPKK